MKQLEVWLREKGDRLHKCKSRPDCEKMNDSSCIDVYTMHGSFGFTTLEGVVREY